MLYKMKIYLNILIIMNLYLVKNVYQQYYQMYLIKMLQHLEKHMIIIFHIQNKINY